MGGRGIINQVLGVILLLLTYLIPISGFGQNPPELLSKLNVETNDSIRCNLYYEIYYAYKYSNSDSAYHYLFKALTEFTEKNYEPGVAQITIYLGRLDVDHGNLLIAEQRLIKALKLFSQLGNKKGMASALNSLGELDGRKGNFETATAYFIKALKLGDEINNDDVRISCYTNLGMINGFTKNFNISLDYYNKALALEKNPKEVRTIANLYSNIGIIYGRMGDFDKALVYFNKIKSIGNKTDFVDVYIYNLMNLGIVYQNKNNESEALKCYNEGLQLAREKKLPAEEMQMLINKASLLSQNQPQLALAHLDTALELGMKLGNKLILDDVYMNMVSINKDLGNYKEVARLLETEMAIKDSLFNIEKAKEIANLQAVHDLDKSNINLKNLDLAMHRQKSKKNIFIAVAVCLLTVVVIVFYYLRKTNDLLKLVSTQKEELTQSNKTKDKLFSIIGHDLRGPLSNVNMLFGSLDQDLDEEERKYFTGLLKMQAQSALNTLDTLLFWGKALMNNNPINIETFDGSEMAKKNIELLTITAEQKNISISNNTHNGDMVTGDSSHFDFVIRNLISNAIKYSNPNGKISVDSSKSPDGIMVFSVKDEGIGIRKERLPVLFDSMGNTTIGTKGEKGTGLGLSLCKEFVQANGGKIWVESEQGNGATFYFCFR